MRTALRMPEPKKQQDHRHDHWEGRRFRHQRFDWVDHRPRRLALVDQSVAWTRGRCGFHQQVAVYARTVSVVSLNRSASLHLLAEWLIVDGASPPGCELAAG